MQQTVSIVIPVFQNKGTLIPTYETIKNEFANHLTDYDYQFVFVNDGSTDGSFEELLDLKKLDPNKIKVINLSRNFGQIAALNAGMKNVDGNFVIGISADQQDPPEIVTKMVKETISGAEVVLAIRKERNDSFFRNLTARIHVWLIRKSTKNYPIGGFDCYLMSELALNEYNKYVDTVRSLQIDILNLGFKTHKIYYERKKREIGETQYNFRKRLRVSLDQVFATSIWPLQFVSILGFLFTSIGFIYGLSIIYAYFFKGTPFQGYAPIVLLQLLIGGIIMIMLGVIGEYQWRIFYEVKKRPQFIIEKIY